MARGWRGLVYRRAVVHTTTGRTFLGLLETKGRDLLVLRDASVVEGTNTVHVDGEVVVERARVEWVQLLPQTTGVQ